MYKTYFLNIPKLPCFLNKLILLIQMGHNKTKKDMFWKFANNDFNFLTGLWLLIE